MIQKVAQGRKGRRPAVPREERQRYLEKLERGIGITRIAKEAGRDIRVVKRNIEIAEQERELALARRDFIRGRLERHQDGLLEEAKRLSSVARSGAPFGLEPDDPVQKRMHDALKQHLLRAALVEDLEAYVEVARDYEARRAAVERALQEVELKLVASLPSGIAPKPWRNTVMSAVSRGFTLGELPEGKYEVITSGHEWRVECDDFIIAIASGFSPEGAAQKVIDAHRQLHSVAESAFPELLGTLQKLKQLGVRLADGLDMLVVTGLVKGRCDYCPV